MKISSRCVESRCKYYKCRSILDYEKGMILIVERDVLLLSLSELCVSSLTRLHCFEIGPDNVLG